MQDYWTSEWLEALGASGFRLHPAQMDAAQDFLIWTARMQTSPGNIDAIRTLQRLALSEVESHFDSEDDGSLMLDVGVIEAVAT